MHGTIKLTEFNSRFSPEQFPLETIDSKPNGLHLTFVRGRDARTRQPIRYRIGIIPATQQGSWTLNEEKGSIENIRTVQNGTTTTYQGIWSENGLRQQVEISIAQSP